MSTDKQHSNHEPPLPRNTPLTSWYVIPEPGTAFAAPTLERVQSVVQHAGRYGVSRIYLLNPNICNFVSLKDYRAYEDLIGDIRQSSIIERNSVHFRKLVSTIKDAGLEAVVSSSVVWIPSGFLNGCHGHVSPFASYYPELLGTDEDFFWRMVEAQVTELFGQCPELDGLDVYLYETNFTLTRLGGHSSHEDKLVKLFSLMANICHRMEKSFSIMCFAHTHYENEEVRRAICRLSPNERLTIRHFTNSCDYHPFMPMNENIGRVGNHYESLEFDCVGEYWGQARIPCSCPEYMAERFANAARSSSMLREVVCRVNWEWGDVFNTPNEANLYAIHRLTKNPDAPAANLMRMWAVEKYGDGGAVAVAEALASTFEITRTIFYLLGFWVSDHSEIPSLEYACDHLVGYGIENIKRMPQNEPIFRELLHPAESTVQMVLQEKDRADALCVKAIKVLESGMVFLSKSDYLDLRRYFELTRNCVTIWRLFSEIFVRYQRYVHGHRDQRSALQTLLKDLAAASAETEQRFGASVKPGNPAAIRSFVQEVRAALKGKRSPTDKNDSPEEVCSE